MSIVIAHVHDSLHANMDLRCECDTLQYLKDLKSWVFVVRSTNTAWYSRCVNVCGLCKVTG